MSLGSQARELAPPASPRLRSPLALPLAVPAALLAGCVLLRAVPVDSGVYPPCPFYALTGWWCPGCGSTRLAGALAHGDLAAAASANPLALAVLPLLALAWISWTARRAGRSVPRLRPSPLRVLAVGAVLVGYGVLRNLPLGAALAPS